MIDKELDDYRDEEMRDPWYAQQEYEDRIAEQAIKEYFQERGAKTGAIIQAKSDNRAKICQAAADVIWARNPGLSKKAVAFQLERLDREKYGSAETTKRIIHKPAKKSM